VLGLLARLPAAGAPREARRLPPPGGPAAALRLLCSLHAPLTGAAARAAAALAPLSEHAAVLAAMLPAHSAFAAYALAERAAVLSACRASALGAAWADASALLALAGPAAGWSPEILGRPGWQHAAGPRPRPAARELTAADLMLPLASVPAAAPGTTLDEAMERLLESGAQALPVTAGAGVVGTVALADLARAMRRAHGLPSIQRVEALMRPPVTVPGAAPAPAAAAAAARSPAGLVVVTAPDGAPAGYLTPGSLLAAAPPAGPGRDGRPRPASSLLVVPGHLEGACPR
jgi:CBS domain-containing protein